MSFNRRDFLKTSGAATMVGAAAGLGLDISPAQSRTGGPDPAQVRETTSICPYCAVGCGLIVRTDRATGQVIDILGDPNHPINQGALCSKGAGLKQLAVNPNRITRVLYRAPNGTKWEPKTWDWALDRIAANIHRDRAASFRTKDEAGRTVNRTETLAHLGSAALDNEECWLLQGIMRSLGLVYIEHQARI